MSDNIEQLLTDAGIRPTSNRILVLRQLLRSENPVSLSDLEEELQTLEKSSVLRVLTLLLDKGVIHSLEDGRGITRYELCHADHTHIMDEIPSEQDHDDMHAHFYCEKCKKVYCLSAIPTPRPIVPDGFKVTSINYMLKGLCPNCRNQR
ncbi:MAG: transcriptional repressor [Prevotella sp.]|nr:transcriptional repressor [Prevotella sp.]MCM1075059.1 transcriptional repressor [Ruminococcus sp.]